MNSPKNPACLLLGYFLSAWLAWAGDVCGRIVDPSGAVVPGAAVSIYARKSPVRVDTLTDAAGEFCVTGLASGSYLAEAAAPGFGETVAVAVDVEAKGQARLDITLELEKVNTRVSVTASSSAQRTDEIQKAFDVVDSAEFARRAEFAIPEALRLVPGLRVYQQGGPGSLASVQVRGMRSFDTSVLIDGFRLRDSSAPQGEATGLLEELYLVDVSRLEILRGSGSSLYGSHAIGGAVNVVTDPGGGPVRGAVDVEGGGLGLVRGGMKLAGGALDDRLLYSGGAAHMNLVSGIDGNDRTRNTSGHAHTQYRFGSSSSLSARILGNDSFLQLNDNPFAAPDSNLPAAGVVPAIALPRDQVKLLEGGLPFQWGSATYAPSPNDPDTRRSAGFLTGLASYSQHLAPAISFRAAYQGVGSRRDTRDGPGGVYFEPAFNNSYRYDGRIDTAEARTDIQAGRHQLISAGYEFERERYDSTSTDENPNPADQVAALSSAAQHSHALFAQDQLRLLSDRLLVSLSGRLQMFEVGQPGFVGGPPAYAGAEFTSPPTAYTGDAAIAYFLARTSTKIRAHAGNGYRAPSLFERLGTAFFFGFFSPFGDPRLSPERSIGIDGGFDQYLASNRLKISGTYFYNRLQQVIAFDFSGAINPDNDPYGRYGGYRNTGGGLSRGVELSVEATPTRTLRVNASYTYTNALERVSSTVDGSLRTYNISDHMFTLLATQRFGRRIDLTFDFAAASYYHFPLFTDLGSRAFRFPGPARGDIVLSYTHPLSDTRSLRLFTRVENVFDRTYYEGGFYTPGAWATAGVKFNF